MRIVPFVAEDEKVGLVIFRVEKENEPDIYICVDKGENGSIDGISVKSFYGIVSYITQTSEPLLAIPDGEFEHVDRAFERLETCPKEELMEMIGRVEEKLQKTKSNEESWKEYCDWENHAIDEVEKAAESGWGEVYF